MEKPRPLVRIFFFVLHVPLLGLMLVWNPVNLNLFYFLLFMGTLLAMDYEFPAHSDGSWPSYVKVASLIMAVCALLGGQPLRVPYAVLCGCFLAFAIPASFEWFGKIGGSVTALLIMAYFARIAFFLLSGGTLVSPLDLL